MHRGGHHVTNQSRQTGRVRQSVARIQGRPSAQVLIIGGGINGIATFRDLAMQGVDVVLIERSDYASGASSASSHMIHGGIRYLENGEFRLVREAVQERNGLLKTAPHYVRPLKTTVPIFSTFSGVLAAPLRFLRHKQGKPKERGALLIKIGLMLYDSFSRDGGTVPRHEFRGRKESLRQLPLLNAGIKYTATYFDASVHEPERLALDVLKDGLATGPHARSANYVEALGLADGGVRVHDRVAGTEFTITANVIINASGPWTDLTNHALGFDTAYMGGTKGSHIVLDNPALLAATGGRELFFEHNDGRIVLIYPLKGRVLVGTTDLEADINEPAVCTEDEVDYFFDLVAHVFPTVVVDRSEIVFRYSGIRPLPKHDDTQPGFVSRDYRIVPSTLPQLPGTSLLSLVGGKWTTFRALAEHLSSETLGLLGVPRKVSTTGVPIGGGTDYPKTAEAREQWIAAHTGSLDSGRVRQLFERYGTRALSVMGDLAMRPDAPLAHTTAFTAAEIAYFAEREEVVHLTDVVLRRTNLAFMGDVTILLLEELSTVLGASLGWDHDRRSAEVSATISELRESHGVTLEPTKVARPRSVS
ncbi:MAG: glycerol-3-phosphate dehydrogenase/oxidase [Lacisediminihabitans sp.]